MSYHWNCRDRPARTNPERTRPSVCIASIAARAVSVLPPPMTIASNWLPRSIIRSNASVWYGRGVLASGQLTESVRPSKVVNDVVVGSVVPDVLGSMGVSVAPACRRCLTLPKLVLQPVRCSIARRVVVQGQHDDRVVPGHQVNLSVGHTRTHRG